MPPVIPVGFLSGAAFTPPALPGCSCWLRADLGVTQSGGKVSAWASQVVGVSGDATQATGANQPTYLSSGVNGKPALSFVAASQNVMSWALSLAGAQTIAIVYKLRSECPVGQAYWLYSMGISNPSHYAYINGLSGYRNHSFGFESGAAASVGYDGLLGTSAAHAVIVAFDGLSTTNPSSYAIDQDGASETPIASNTLSASGSFLGFATGTSFYADADYYEVVAYERALSAPERARLWSYFRARYAL